MKPHDTAPRVQLAYRRLLDEIEHGRYPARSLLPPGRVLCRQYAVSRPTLGKAVAQLVEEGRLQTRPGAGTVVLPRAPSDTRVVSLMSIMDDDLMVHVQRRALGLGYLLNIFLHQETSWDPQIERRFLQCVKEQRSLALLAFCSPLAPTNDDMLAEVAASGVRVIHTEPYRIALPAQEYLMPDYRGAAHLAVVKLLLAGCRRIRVMGHWDRPSPSSLQIEQGVAAAIEDHLGPYDPEAARLPLWTAPDYENGRVRGMLAELPAGTGLVYTSLRCAGLASRFLAEAGRPPDDVRLIAVETVQAATPAAVDRLVFDRAALFDRTLEALGSRNEEPLRELVKAEWQPAVDPAAANGEAAP